MRRVIIILLLFAGCSGGGNSPPGPPPQPSEILRWEQPEMNMDNTILDIKRDVSRWDIYCTFFSKPLDNEIVASVANIDNTMFNLSLLRQYGIEPGPDGKLLFIKCVRNDNAVSDFSEPAFWR